MNIDDVTWKVDPARIDRMMEFSDGVLRESFRQVLESTADLPFEHYIIYSRGRNREITGYLSILSLKEGLVPFFRPEGKENPLQHIEDIICAETVYIPENDSMLATALANKYRDTRRGENNTPSLDFMIPDSIKTFYQSQGNLVEKRLFHNTLFEKFKTYIYVFRKDQLKRVSEISQWVLLLSAGFIQGAIIPNLKEKEIFRWTKLIKSVLLAVVVFPGCTQAGIEGFRELR